MLEKQGVKVEIETSPSTALERVANEDFDLVLTDVNMEGMTGIELCQHLRDGFPDLLTIVITGESDTMGKIR